MIVAIRWADAGGNAFACGTLALLTAWRDAPTIAGLKCTRVFPFKTYQLMAP